MDNASVYSQLGLRYQDKATGLTGVCVGVWVSYGNVQLQLAMIVSNEPKSFWIDEARLREIPPEIDSVGFKTT